MLRTTKDLTAAQLRLVLIMSEYQFGRVENMAVRAGQPHLNSEVRVVRVARLGGASGGINVPTAIDFELKQSVCDLLDELVRFQNGTILKLEFRHGLPYLLEITASTIQGGCSE
jgi:hypothetical protein